MIDTTPTLLQAIWDLTKLSCGLGAFFLVLFLAIRLPRILVRRVFGEQTGKATGLIIGALAAIFAVTSHNLNKKK